MKNANPNPLTPKLRTELNALAAMPDSEIDTTEMPPLSGWTRAVHGPNPSRANNCPSTTTRKETAEP